ncbi:MAG: hypothetical protein K8R88_10655 [Armatimonadetes bacterium]|nr:hypothetical protein [Armatimonadota bacterium]
MAHPFDSATSEWASLLQTALQGYGIKTTLPISSKSSGVLFCKVCQQIRGSSAIVSELTTLNRNVIFEHGFALGIGCRGIIARNKNRSVVSILDVLRDIERVEYDSVDEVAEAVAQLGIQGELGIVPSTNAQPKLLGEWDFSSFKTNSRQVCLLKGGQPQTDSIRRLQRVLRQSDFRPVEIDPDEYTSHQLYDYAKNIKESFAVVGHFVTDQNPKHQELNALTALLLGLSVGMGKRIAVFQEQPMSHQMIDLGGVLHGYQRLAVLQDKLEDFLKSWKLDADKIEAAQKKEEDVKRIHRAILDLGNPAAEADSLLSKAFYYTQYAQWAEFGQKFLIIGAKGAGKSAIYKYLCDHVEFPTKSKPIFLEFTTFEVHRLMSAAERLKDHVNPDLLFRSFWRANLIIELSQAILLAAGTGYKSSAEYQSLEGWILNLGLNDSTDYFDRFLRVVGVSDTDLLTLTRDQFVALRFNQAEPWLRELLKGWKLLVFADRLDEAWETGSKPQKDYLRAFVHECFLLSNSMGHTVHPVLFLREDILASIRKGDQESDKWNIGIIEWSKTELKAMIAERIRAGAEMASDKEFSWDSLLPQTFQGQTTIDYLLDRTYLRPRDLIVLLQWVINHAQSAGGLPAEEPAIRKALSTFAENKLANLANEVTMSAGSIEDITKSLLACFSGGWTSTEGPILDSLKRYGTPEETMQELYDAGVLCFFDEADRIMTSKDYTFEVARNLAKREVQEPRAERGLFGLRKRVVPVAPAGRLVTLRPALHGLLDRTSQPVEFRSEAALQGAC